MSSPPSDAVVLNGLRKSFHAAGKAVEAVRGIDLTVSAGEIFGLLGPNGAGKTTTLRILTTLLHADAGFAFVAGADVRRDPALVRRRIGYVGQLGGADASATGRENLLLAGRLYGLSAVAARSRSASCTGHRCCFSMSRQPGSTPRTGRTYGRCSGRCGTAAAPCSSPRTILTKPTTPNAVAAVLAASASSSQPPARARACSRSSWMTTRPSRQMAARRVSVVTALLVTSWRMYWSRTSPVTCSLSPLSAGAAQSGVSAAA